MNWLRLACRVLTVGAASLAGLCAPAATNTLRGNICIIDSYGREIAPFGATELACRDAVLEVLATTVNTELHVISLDDARDADPGRHERMAGALDKGIPKPIVLVAALGETAARFAAKYRARLFPDAGIVFVADAAGLAAEGIVTANDVVIPFTQSPSGTVENILTLLPETTNIAVVIGNSDLEKKWVKKCRATFGAFTNRVGFTYLNKLAFKTVTNAVAQLPPRSAVLYLMMVNDAAGRAYDHDKTLVEVHAAANAPVFGCFESQMGVGIVGGRLIQNRAVGLAAAKVIIRLFHKGTPAEFATPLAGETPPVYDERELRRWDISEDLLPPGSRVEFRGPGMWEQYQGRIIAVCALLAAQAGLIIVLLVHRRRLVKAQAEVRKGQEHMRQAAKAASLGLWVWDVRTDRIWATSVTQKLFGLTEAEEVDLVRFFRSVHPDDREGRTQRMRALMEEPDGNELEDEFRVRHADGTIRWISLIARTEHDRGGRPLRLSGIVLDITARIQAENNAHELRTELAHVTRVSMMGELSASLAHELNQPLAAILSNAQAARRFLAAPETDLREIRDILDDIIKDDKRAGEVIHRLRSLVQKRERIEPEAVNLNDLVLDAERLLNSEIISRNVELVLDLAPALPAALAGRVEIQQVLLNLMVNAMDAMRDQPAQARRLMIETKAVDGTVHVAVRDSGPGIPDHVMPDIFRPFFTTKQHGLGMGLTICRSMLESCGGRLWAENHPEGGALFQFELRRL